MFASDNFSTFLTEEDYNELRGSGLSAQEILQCGHFSITDAKEGKRITGIKHRGLVFRYLDPASGTPYTTSQGKPFYRMKPRDWSETMRDWHEEPPKYLSPPKEGNRPYWSPLIESFNKKSKAVSVPLEIVEGEKKADSLAAEGYFVLGLSGVWGWLDKSGRAGETDIPPAPLMEDEKEEQDKLGKLEESRLLPELIDQIEWRHRRVNISFDSDLWQKTGVREAAKALASSLKELGAVPHIVRIPNECNGEKNGADDLKVRHGIESYKALCKISQPLRIGKNKQIAIGGEPSPLGKIFMAWSVLKDEWKYRPSVGWYRWTGKYWQKRSDSEFEKALVYFQDAQDWQGVKGMDVLVRQLRSRLLEPEESWNPSRFLVFENGVLDLDENQFSEGHPNKINNTSILPYAYDADATCPTWTSFLHQALGGDTDAIGLLQAFIKWILVPKPKDRKAEIEKSLDIVGDKGTGKGTFLDVVTSLVGPGNCGSIGKRTFASENGLTALLDKKVSIYYDAFGFFGDIDLFNQVVSNEPVPIKFLYKDVGEARLGTTIVRAYNRFPEVPDGSDGLDRRIIVVGFNHQPKEIDLELSAKLQKELAGIFQWAWSVPLAEVKRRITWAGHIPSVAEASVQRFEANNPEYTFLMDCFPQGAKGIKAGDLYQSYVEWTKNNGIATKKQRKFAEMIQRLGCKKSEKVHGCYYYTIPSIESFDVTEFLGLKRGIVDFQKSLPPQLSPTVPRPLPEPIQLSPELSPELSPPVPNCPPSESADENEDDVKYIESPFEQEETFTWWGEEVRVDRIGRSTLYCLPVNGPIDRKISFIRVPFDEAERIKSESAQPTGGQLGTVGGQLGDSCGGQLNPCTARAGDSWGQLAPQTFLKTQSEIVIRLGDWCKYTKDAFEGSLKRNANALKVQVLEIKGDEALCKAPKWLQSNWCKISHLQFVEHGELPEEEKTWSVGDRVNASWPGSPSGQVLEVKGDEVRVLFEDSEDAEGCWVHESELTPEEVTVAGRES